MNSKFEGFSETFLKSTIKGEFELEGEKRTIRMNVAGKDYYKILGLDGGKLKGKSVERSNTVERTQKTRDIKRNDEGFELDSTNIDAYLDKLRREGKTARKVGNDKIEETYWHEELKWGQNDTYEDIRKAWRKNLGRHSDKGGTGYGLVDEAWKVLGNQESKQKYDQLYEDIISDDANKGNFKQRVKNRLKKLARKKLKISGEVKSSDGGENKENEDRDISAYAHLFLEPQYTDGTIDRAKSKKGISKYANWVVYVYQSCLISLERELKGDGRAVHNRNGEKIDISRLGSLSNFKKEIWDSKIRNSKDDVDSYVNLVKNKIKGVVHGKNAPKNDFPWQDAHEEVVLPRLRAISVDGLTWNDLEGPEEGEQNSEQCFFVNGHTYEPNCRGIRMLKFDNPNHSAYQEVIEKAKILLKAKVKVPPKLQEIEDLNSREGGNVNQQYFGELKEKLRNLGKLEMVGFYDENNKSGYTLTHPRMRFKNANEIDPAINQIFQEFRKEITARGSKPRDNSNKNSGGGGGNSGNTKTAAVQEIENALKEVDLEEKQVGMKPLWRNDFYFGNNNIEIFKNTYLDNIYRVAARKKIEQELREKSLSLDILGMGSDLKSHFKGIKGKSEINAERNRLLGLIANYNQNQEQDAEKAAAEVKREAQENNLGESEIEEILGKDWEERLLGWKDKIEIEKLKNNYIQRIKDFVAQNKDNFSEIIKEIEKALQEAGFSEKILGENWKSKLEGKSEEETKAERDRLMKIIEEHINKQAREGKISGTQAKNKKETLIENKKKQEKVDIEKKLKEGHQKLAVEEKELPSSLFAPHKTLAEKLNSLNTIEEIAEFDKKVVAAIKHKKEEKLTVIKEEAITQIKAEIESSSSEIELGKNKDFKRKIREAKDPDEIELLKENILALIREQKSSSGSESIDDLNNTGSPPNQISWSKVLGIAALIILPLVVVVLIILRVRRKKLGREKLS